MFKIVQTRSNGREEAIVSPEDPTIVMTFETSEEASSYMPLIDIGECYGDEPFPLRIVPA